MLFTNSQLVNSVDQRYVVGTKTISKHDFFAKFFSTSISISVNQLARSHEMAVKKYIYIYLFYEYSVTTVIY